MDIGKNTVDIGNNADEIDSNIVCSYYVLISLQLFVLF